VVSLRFLTVLVSRSQTADIPHTGEVLDPWSINLTHKEPARVMPLGVVYGSLFGLHVTVSMFSVK